MVNNYIHRCTTERLQLLQATADRSWQGKPMSSGAHLGPWHLLGKKSYSRDLGKRLFLKPVQNKKAF